MIRKLDKTEYALATSLALEVYIQCGAEDFDLMGFVLLLLLISYIIIHRDAKSIKQYKHKTTALIRQLEQSVQRNEALITSRKKAVHTITLSLIHICRYKITEQANAGL